MLYLALPGPTELWVILLVVVLLFGARKIPELARAMGSGITQFKRGLKDEQDKPDELGGGDPPQSLSEGGEADPK